MGLYSDILEEIYENEYSDFVPNMMVDWSYHSRPACSYGIVSKKEVGTRISDYKTSKVIIKNTKATPEEIRRELNELENIEYVNRMNEKQLLYVRNKAVIKSRLVNDLIDEMLELIEESCNYIDKVKGKIDSKGITINYSLKEVNEPQLRKELLYTIYRTVYLSIKRGLPMSVSFFRKVVKDLIQLTMLMDSNTQNEKIDKFFVEEYFKSISGTIQSSVVCHNCGRPLLKNIPYCFNCYEGRFS